jgi:2,3-bisphosphoglycerate-independent phosphoglycerate mutase
MSATPKPLVLIILDGFGHSDNPEANAIMAANTPVYDQLRATRPHGLISGSGMDVGLPDGQMGNSEVGHMNLGAGRVVYQDFTRVTKAIRDGEFFENPTLTGAVDKAVAAGKAVHILGLLSDGGVHSHQDHLVAMAELAARRGAEKIYLHAFLDGRDTPPRSAQSAIELLDAAFAKLGKGRIASLIGRYFAMDRDNRWDRVEQAYQLIVDGHSQFQANSAVEGLQAAYARDESDEFVKATCIDAPVKVEDGDAVVFMNFRADRARELTRALAYPDFAEFDRGPLRLGRFVCMTQYDESFRELPVAFPPEQPRESFPELLAQHGLRQLRTAETEKYAHVTFFFNGGREVVYPGEERLLIPSPRDVKTYDLKPEMSAREVTAELGRRIESGGFDFALVNFANPDMVGHTGVLPAAIEAVKVVDECLGKLARSCQAVGWVMVITADHGNIELMVDPETGEPHTAHTLNPVPFVLAHPDFRGARLRPGVLADIAPTLCRVMGLPQPREMNLQSLL